MKEDNGMIRRWTLLARSVGSLERLLGYLFLAVILAASIGVASTTRVPPIAWSNALCAAAYCVCFLQFHRGMSNSDTCLWISWISGVGLCFESWFDGGIYASTLAWFYVTVMANYFLVGRRAGLLWALLVLGIYLVLALGLENHGLASDADVLTQSLTTLINYSASLFLSLLVLMHYHQSNVRLYRTLRIRQRRLQAQREALERTLSMRGRFMASVSHALRNPLNAILGLNDLLLAKVKDKPRSLMVLEHTRKSADHLMALIDDALAFTGGEAGQARVHWETVAIRETVTNAFALFEPRIAAAGLQYACEFDPQVPHWIQTDKHRLTQIVVNLLGNAVKFTIQGSIRLQVNKTDDAQLVFSVQDSGIGIPLEDQRKLFARFGQANEAIQTRFGGSGLGLTISLELAKLLEGSMGFESMPGVGSRFWLALPCRAMEQPPSQIRPQLPTHSGDRAWHFLVVDDHPVNRFLLRRVLFHRWPRARVEEAQDGLQALAACQRQPFDLILMDLVMPELDGTATTRALRDRAPATARRIPIIGLTANVHPPDLALFQAAGLDALMLKPFDSNVLYAQMEHLLAQGPAPG